MNRNIFEQIAKNNNVSEEEVRREIAAALSFANCFGEGEVPDAESAIVRLAEMVKENLK